MDIKATLQDDLRPFTSGKEEFSAAALDYLRVMLEVQRQATRDLLGP